MFVVRKPGESGGNEGPAGVDKHKGGADGFQERRKEKKESRWPSVSPPLPPDTAESNQATSSETRPPKPDTALEERGYVLHRKNSADQVLDGRYRVDCARLFR